MQLISWVNTAWAQPILILCLSSAFYPLSRAWKGARGTALRPVLVWAVLAVGLGIVAQLFGLSETVESGNPLLGRFTYLAALASLAALVSVLNARTPGAWAWALLMAMLVVVFLIPWLEEPGRFRQAQGLRHLRLDAPWTIFFVLVAGTGVTNYLPTRYGPAAAFLGLGYALEYLSLTRPDWSSATRAASWSGFSWCLAAAIWIAYWRATKRGDRIRDAHALDQAWLWFRDHWGVVWGLRIVERFNKTAELAQWPCRLAWFGTIGAAGRKQEGDPSESVVVPEVAVSTFKGLLRRFVTPGRLEEIRDIGSDLPSH